MPYNITSLINRLSRNLHCRQFADGLNPAQWEALRYLARANRFSRTPTALAEYLGTTRGTASQTLKALESKGYIRRVPVPKDRRAVRLEVTAGGQALLDRDPLHKLEAAAARLGPADLGAAHSALTRLVANLEHSSGLKGFGFCRDCQHFCRNDGSINAGVEAHHCRLERESLSADDAVKICANHAA